MTANEIRAKYLTFMKEHGHAILPSSPLVPQNDPTTLFTGSGMQPLVPFLLGREHPAGKRIADSQKCFRSMDIEEVGDNRHTTFFEMLGNWSLGDYFKKEQLSWFFEFLTDIVGLDPERLYVTAFLGDEKHTIPKDTESVEIWKELFSRKGIEALDVVIGSEADGYERGMQGGRIFYYDAKKNWWSRSGVPENMPAGEPGGPDSEVFYDFGPNPSSPGGHSAPECDEKFGKECHPNCDCGRFLEIGNSVFMQYLKEADGTFSLLPKQNVDFGGGLERIVAVSHDEPDIFTLNHGYLLDALERGTGTAYRDNVYAYRVIADHIKAAAFLIADGVRPSNKDQGYFVRRLIRRSKLYANKLNSNFRLGALVPSIVDAYKDQYPELGKKHAEIDSEITEEEARFSTTLERGLKELAKGTDAFTLFTTYGFPFELSKEIAKERGIDIDEESFRRDMAKHQDLSRAGSEQKFKGGLADTSEETMRLHTAHHLLLKALQNVLGEHVHQRGSNITGERLRIDFSHGEKMTDEQKQEVERIVNMEISAALPVIQSTIPKEEAEALGAEHEFGAKYPDVVSVYSIGPKEATAENPQFEKALSIEFCGGPHVTNTRELAKSGTFKIQREEAVAVGVRRIRAVLFGG